MDLFERKGQKGQSAVVDFIVSQVKDVLNHFISSLELEKIKTPELIRKQLEDNGHHKKMIDKMNEQIYQFKVRNDDTEENFATYAVERIKIGSIELPEPYKKAMELQLATTKENETKEMILNAKKKRAEDAGISVKELTILEGGGNVSETVISGNKKKTSLLLSPNNKI